MLAKRLFRLMFPKYPTCTNNFIGSGCYYCHYQVLSIAQRNALLQIAGIYKGQKYKTYNYAVPAKQFKPILLQIRYKKFYSQ